MDFLSSKVGHSRQNMAQFVEADVIVVPSLIIGMQPHFEDIRLCSKNGKCGYVSI